MIRQILIRIREKILEEERKEERRKQLIKSGDYIVSKNADVNNILIDTCAMKTKKGLNIIEKSRRARILYVTLEEIDKRKLEINKKNTKDKMDNEFISNVAKCAKLILQNPNFKVIFVDNKKNEYVDNVILRYLRHIPRRKRPTLLTEDKLLAAKAKGLGIEYICIVPDSQTKTAESEKTETKKVEVTKVETKKVEIPQKQLKNIKSKQPQKKLVQQKNIENRSTKCPKTMENASKPRVNVVGKSISYSEGKLKIISYSKDGKIFSIREGECEELNISFNKENIFEKEIDYLVVTKYLPKYKIVKIIKIVFGKEILQEVYECKVVNEIYKLPFPEEVLEKAKNQLTGVTY